MKYLVAILLLVLVATMVVIAQDEPPPIGDCTQEQYDAIAGLLMTAAEDLQAGNVDQETLLPAQVGIATLRAFCDGYVFTSEEYGNDVITDPISFRDGVYRAVFESPALARVSIEELSGDCDFGFMSVMSDGGEDQEIWQLDGCVALLDFSGREGWSLRLEPIVSTEE